MARTFLDKHYNQRINSAQTKMQFVTESYNEGFVMPAALLVGAEKDIVFGPLPANEQKTEPQLQRKFEVMSKGMRDINIASQEQSILNRITVKTHAIDSRGRLIPEGGLLASFIMREWIIPRRKAEKQEFFSHSFLV